MFFHLIFCIAFLIFSNICYAETKNHLSQSTANLSLCMHTNYQPIEMQRQIKLGNDTKFVTLTAEIALMPEEHARGLMCRTDLLDNHGMLFFFSPPRIINMWMKNTPLSLDMFFIGQNGVINEIIENAEPFSEKNIYSQHDTMFVLEMKAGFAKNNNLKVGDVILDISEI